MKIVRVELENFRQFNGLQICEPSTSRDRNVTVIYGMNGAGKSNFLYALTWCLFGTVVPERGPLVCKESALNRKFGDVLKCSVRIHLSHGADTYVVSRTSRCRKIEPRLIKNDDDEPNTVERYRVFDLETLPGNESDFSVLKCVGAEFKQIDSPTSTTNLLLPPGASKYFLFDGTRINELTDVGHEYEVKEAIQNILQLPALQRAYTHLESFSYSILPKAGKSGHVNQKDQLIADLESYNIKIQETKIEIVRLEKCRREAEKAKQDKAEALNKYRGIQDKIESRNSLNKRIGDLDFELQTIHDELKTIVNRSYALLSVPWMAELVKQINQSVQNQPPSALIGEFLQKVLDGQQCICGNGLLIGSDNRKKLKV